MTQGERPRAVPRLSLLLVTMTRSKDNRDILECRFFQSYNRHIQEKGGTPYADHIQNPCRSLCAGADPACGRASFLLSLSAGLLSILASVLGLLSVLMLFVEKDISTGIAGLLMAFAISPFGLPALAGWLLAKLDELNGSLRGFIMG